jgi:sarcosine oxidase subunit gamma
MVEPISPLGNAYRPGSHGDFVKGVGVVLAETRPGSIVEAACWPDKEKALLEAIRDATGLALPTGAGAGVCEATKSAFGIGPGRFLVIDQAEDLSRALTTAVGGETGTVTDLSHGRSAFRIEGPKAEWVLSKLFAIDFAQAAFPLGAGRATAHHDIHAQIQRVGDDAFDLYVFRSFARSFWRMLGHAAEEVGYEVR